MYHVKTWDKYALSYGTVKNIACPLEKNRHQSESNNQITFDLLPTSDLTIDLLQQVLSGNET